MFKVDRPFRNRLFMSGSYLYGESTSILDGTVVAGGVELGQRLRARRPEQSAAHALELRSGSPHHDLGRLRHPDARRSERRRRRSSTAASPAVRGRRSTALDDNGDVAQHERPALHPGERHRGHVHQRHLRRSCRAVHRTARSACRTSSARSTSATRAARPGQHAGLPPQRRAAVQARQGGDHLGHPQPDQPVRQPERALRVRELQRPARSSVPTVARHRRRSTTICGTSSCNGVAADSGGAVHPRRPAVAVADAARGDESGSKGSRSVQSPEFAKARFCFGVRRLLDSAGR